MYYTHAALRSGHLAIASNYSFYAHETLGSSTPTHSLLKLLTTRGLPLTAPEVSQLATPHIKSRIQSTTQPSLAIGKNQKTNRRAPKGTSSLLAAQMNSPPPTSDMDARAPTMSAHEFDQGACMPTALRAPVARNKNRTKKEKARGKRTKTNTAIEDAGVAPLSLALTSTTTPAPVFDHDALLVSKQQGNPQSSPRKNPSTRLSRPKRSPAQSRKGALTNGVSRTKVKRHAAKNALQRLAPKSTLKPLNAQLSVMETFSPQSLEKFSFTLAADKKSSMSTPTPGGRQPSTLTDIFPQSLDASSFTYTAETQPSPSVASSVIWSLTTKKPEKNLLGTRTTSRNAENKCAPLSYSLTFTSSPEEEKEPKELTKKYALRDQTESEMMLSS
ncbi:hypothetical protein K458DRAFT_404735 [Lentithecium fluviatile CBS 122367]|uniref:Uncharacterized protein n=1 Tax=Lentithecium fluviatile CBS 122367 TaxID=1168545 RepID=A0A6G1J0T1_9PLEO|nr:hypothetical protein K458DRAFT_404735 [Lentithecium fluviatile CBS 122367]